MALAVDTLLPRERQLRNQEKKPLIYQEICVTIF